MAARVTRFRREARATAGLSHPAIVQVYDILVVDGGELEGGTLVVEILRSLPLARPLVT